MIKMKYIKSVIISLLFFVMVLPISAQSDEWTSLSDDNYTIEYPENWLLDQSGQLGALFFLFSGLESEEDQFNENINLMIQDLSGLDIDLDKFVKISEAQIETMITDGKIIKSERIKKRKEEYQKAVYTGSQGIYKLKFEQYYWVIKDRAYILTLTCEEDEFEKYQAIGEKILDSFKIE